MVYSFQDFKLWHLLVYTQPFLCLLYAADAACFGVSKWKTLSLFLKHSIKTCFLDCYLSWDCLCTKGQPLIQMPSVIFISSAGYYLNKVQTVAWRIMCYYSQLAQISSLSSLFIVHFTIFLWEIKITLLLLSALSNLAAERRMWSYTSLSLSSLPSILIPMEVEGTASQ